MLLPLLPSSCSALIKKHGVPLRQWNPGSEEVALNKEGALELLEALRDSSIAVLGGDVVCIDQGRLRYVYAQWSCERNAGETSAEFAKRSQHMAYEYVLNFCPAENYEPLFVFVFSALVERK